MNTQVKWNTEKPTLEMVYGKTVMVAFISNSDTFPDVAIIKDFNTLDYGAYFGEPYDSKYNWTILEHEKVNQPESLQIAGIPIHIVKNGVPDNYPQWGFLSVSDAEKVARIINSIVEKLTGEK